MGLNARQQKFLDGFLATGNATQAYIDAGYKSKGHAAEASAHALLRNPEISCKITEVEKTAAEQAGVTAEWVVERLQRVIAIGLGEQMVKKTLVVKGAVVGEVEVRALDLAATNAALEKLGKSIGMFAGDEANERGDVHVHFSENPIDKDTWAAKHALH